MSYKLDTYNIAEREAARGARLLCKAHASNYAKDDIPAATFAALWLALEQEAAEQNIKMRLLFGYEE